MQLGAYPTPTNISYAWSYGSLAGLTMAVQVLSGVIIDTSYSADTGNVSIVLDAVQRDAWLGWFVRAAHSNVVSLLFVWLYCHQARSLLVGSRAIYAWTTGWVLVLITIIVAFLGYSCVWG